METPSTLDLGKLSPAAIAFVNLKAWAEGANDWKAINDAWNALSRADRDVVREPPTPAALAPFEGDRVEVVTTYGETRRFWVGRSTGWRPSFLEVKTTRSMGGGACDREYHSIRLVRRGPRR